MAYTVPWNLIGLQVSGDYGDLTIYTDRYGKKVAFPKSPPKKPPSDLQIAQRSTFRFWQLCWTLLLEEERKALEDVARQLSLCMTGQNLWMHY